jgi:hypothetical protein
MLMVSALDGCTAQPPATRDALVGNYLYVSEDPENRQTDHDWDRLTLQADGKYELVQGGSTKSKSDQIGAWSLSSGEAPQVLLDHAGFPVSVKRGKIRLLIDSDVGTWYEKDK